MEDTETIAGTITKIQSIAAQLSGVQENSQQLDVLLEEIKGLADKASSLIEDNASRLANDIFRREFRGRTKVKLSEFVETLHPSDSHSLRSNLRAGMQAGTLPGEKSGEHWYVTPDTLAAWFRLKIKREENGRMVKLAA